MVLASTDPTGVTITLVLLYFVPTIIALMRKVPSQGSVVVVNLFLGWTLIGWVVALAMAARSVPASQNRDSSHPIEVTWKRPLTPPAQRNTGTPGHVVDRSRDSGWS